MRKLGLGLASLVGLGLLVGCARGPSYTAPSQPRPERVPFVVTVMTDADRARAQQAAIDAAVKAVPIPTELKVGDITFGAGTQRVAGQNQEFPYVKIGDDVYRLISGSEAVRFYNAKALAGVLGQMDDVSRTFWGDPSAELKVQFGPASLRGYLSTKAGDSFDIRPASKPSAPQPAPTPKKP